VVVQARKPEAGRKYFLRKLRLDPPHSIQAQERAIARAAGISPQAAGVPPVDPDDFAPGQILAQLVIEGDEVSDQKLPETSELAGLVPKDLADIKPEEIDPASAQKVELKQAFARCGADGRCEPCAPGPAATCRFKSTAGSSPRTPRPCGS
jgi:hypothetical protein